MLKVVGTYQADLRGSVGVGSMFPVEWVDIHEPSAPIAQGPRTPSVFPPGFRPRRRRFSRLEGASYNPKNQRVYIVSTDGGQAREGQVWEYYPRDEQLRLVFESSDEEELDNPDNIGTSADGDIVLCEDVI